MTKKDSAHGNEGSWYGALVVFESVFPDANTSQPVFEIRAMLLRAPTEDVARKKADQLANTEQQEYTNTSGDRVTWRFKEVIDVCCLSWVDTFAEGTEAYYAHVGAEGLAEIKRALQRAFPA